MSDLSSGLADMTTAEFEELLRFANRVQSWSFGDGSSDRQTTFGDAAAHFNVPVQRIADAVEAHYWMFTTDEDRPLAERRIDHEGE